MPETISVDADGTTKWMWYDVLADLVNQGGLDKHDLFIDPTSFLPHSFGGTYKHRRFYVSWAKDALLMLTMADMQPDLVAAFAAVVGYKPFAQYHVLAETCIEWAKNDAEARWPRLQGADDLVRLEP